MPVIPDVITRNLAGHEITISKYEAKRYFSDRLVRGFTKVINPITGVLFGATGSILEDVRNICIAFHLPYSHDISIPTTTTQGDVTSPIEHYDEHLAHYIRTNREIPAIDKNDTTYVVLLNLLVTLNLDLHHIHNRTNRDVPQMTELPNPPNSQAAYIEKYKQVIEVMTSVITLLKNQLDTISNIKTAINSLYESINKSYRISADNVRILIHSTESQLRYCKNKIEDIYLAYVLNYPNQLPENLNIIDLKIRDKINNTKEQYTDILKQLVDINTQIAFNSEYESKSKSRHSSRSIRSRKSSNDIINRRVINDYSIICVTNLNEIHPKYKRLKTKLIKICDTIVKKEHCELFEPIVNNIRANLMDFVLKYEFTNIDSKNVLGSVYNLYKKHPNLQKTYFLKNLFANFTMNRIFIDIGGVGPGIIIEFLRLLMEDLRKHQVFISYRKGERYFINPHFKVSRSFSKLTGIESETDILHFYEFIGRLFALFIINNFGLDFHLSHCILAHMIYKHTQITNEDYIGYAMMDFPVEYKGLIQILKKPEDAQYIGNFNDFYYIKETDDEINEDNYIEYLERLSKHRLLKQLYGYKDVTHEDTPLYMRTYDRFMSMVKGFQTIRKVLRSNKITIPMLDLLLTSKDINQDTINKLIIRFNEISALNVPDYVRENMIRILRDNGEHFPYDVIGKTKPNDKEAQFKIFVEFIKKLLIFWTSNHSFNESYNYNIRLIESTNPDEIPKSHTCYQQIDIPIIYANDFHKLYEKIVQASFYSAGFDFMGGNKKTRSKVVMPYIIKEVVEKGKTGYKVCKKATPKKCFSKAPLTKEKATKQRTAIILSEKGLSKKK